MITTSEIKTSVVIDEKYMMELAVRPAQDFGLISWWPDIRLPPMAAVQAGIQKRLQNRK